MIKKVNIKASVPIKDFRPPIYGTCNGIDMTTGEILKCLCKRAIVDEVLPDGSTIRLDMKNYYTDNTPKTTKVPAADKVQVVETSVPVEVHNEAPVVELEQVVECETTTATTNEADAVEEYVPEEDTTAEVAVVAGEADAVEEVTKDAESTIATANPSANKTTTYNNNNGGKKKKKY